MSLNEKLLAVQAATPTVQKNAINPHFGNRYVTLDAVLDAVMPVLTENGIILSQECDVMNGQWGYTNIVRTVLTDAESGEWKASSMALGYETNPQKIGSSVTYARRYTLLSVLALTADEDDDANLAASGHIGDRAEPAKPLF